MSAANNLAARQYYRRNREKILAKQRHDRTVKNPEKWKARRQKVTSLHTEKIGKIKSAQGCADCGYNEHPAALDFDHKPGCEKKFHVSAACGRKWETILAEIDKCEVVCANCHRIRTFERRRSNAR